MFMIPLSQALQEIFTGFGTSIGPPIGGLLYDVSSAGKIKMLCRNFLCFIVWFIWGSVLEYGSVYDMPNSSSTLYIT